MVIQVKAKNGFYFIQGKAKDKQPQITPFRGKAWNFSDLAQCKNVRDDVLEYFPGAVIC